MSGQGKGVWMGEDPEWCPTRCWGTTPGNGSAGLTNLPDWAPDFVAGSRGLEFPVCLAGNWGLEFQCAAQLEFQRAAAYTLAQAAPLRRPTQLSPPVTTRPAHDSSRRSMAGAY